MKKPLLLMPLLAALALPAHAAAVAQLKAFVAGTRTVSAQFEQTVTSQGRQERAHGTLEISRPGKFRWSYAKPYEQLIVGDGKRLWIYDKELAQVTSRALDAALGSSPAALLAGDNAIEANYKLREAGKQGGIEWLVATPRLADSGFSSLKMGFAGNTLKEMQLTDSFGNVTDIRFDALKKNPPLAADRFRFAAPPGVDVLSE
ncbi:outer membrane lipoprotein chaperone LolA [Crenobacter caeni]|uniref:Outer-membrane lipoprotein carrier protein n=1 Tax=Crenobacter caeni TaxID=2705474 RepID=A0A6B2KNP5_9NEIS|nr:outer membrane lipoprotein chaperone LolA [Crenobacter caeni]NDV11778.1 outer membrane lipoprotein chaperone LolA [Crenobacter caeni]